jgi:hypothetical protein
MGNKQQAKAIVARKRKSFTHFLAVFKNTAEVKATAVNKEAAKQIAVTAREVILSQRYRWKALSPRYVNYKKKYGLDPRFHIATGEYVNAISWGVSHGKVWAGIPTRKVHSGSGKPLWLLARWLEFGTRRMPPRPVWRYVVSQVMKYYPKLAAQYKISVYKKLQEARKGWTK